MSKKEELQKLKEEVSKNTSLPLREGATKLVFGVGNPEASILFIGEAPGFNEDQQGEPFVGNAGKLLDKMLVAIDFRREDVYITNVVMYRPPNNRDPLPEELEAFAPYIERIVQIIDPSLIVTLGRFSMAKFLKDVRITQVHGKLYKRKFGNMEVFVMPMFHPSAALRGTGVMDMFKNDFEKLPRAVKKVTEIKSK